MTTIKKAKKVYKKMTDENGKYIKDEKGKFIYETDAYGHKVYDVEETEYRIDPDFIPQTADEICLEYIDAFCEADKDRKVWWDEIREEFEEEKDNGEKVKRYRSYPEIVKAFIAKYYPNLAPKKKQPIIGGNRKK